jgi:redox-sensitive bicupin YhaK (pirin superfamily)
VNAPQRIAASHTELGGGMQVRRALPTRARRLIGAWCFVDHFGPATVANTPGLRVGPHPHIGLQTVTWLIEGEVLHRDSLGSEQLIRPGQLNLMTAGRGIAHSEESPTPRSANLHGLQLWIALPDAARMRAPAFDHYAALPRLQRDGAALHLLAGELLGERSPAQLYSELLGVDVDLPAGASVELPLRADFEHGVVVARGAASVDGAPLAVGELLYCERNRNSLTLRSDAGARAFVFGGVPLAEPVLMWWNFVAREKQELDRACRDWNAHAGYFGEVRGYDGERLVAPLPPWSAPADGATVSYP